VVLKNISAFKIVYEKHSQQIYDYAVILAAKEIGRRAEVFPKKCKFSFNKIVDLKFIPVSSQLPFRPWQITNGADIIRDLQQSGFHYDNIKPHEDINCKYYALEKQISTKLCTIAVAIPDETKSLVDAVLFSVNKNPKVLFNKKFPEKYLAEVREFIRINEKTLKNYWDGTYCSADLFENLKTHQGYWFIERAFIGTFKSNNEELKVYVWANEDEKVRIINVTKHYEAEINILDFKGSYYNQKRGKHIALKKVHIDNFKKFLNSEATHEMNNKEKLFFIWSFINSNVNHRRVLKGLKELPNSVKAKVDNYEKLVEHIETIVNKKA
jgi:hypothetical protein